MVNKISSEGVECTILQPGFQSVCLSPWVLERVHGSLKLFTTAIDDNSEHAIEGATNE